MVNRNLIREFSISDEDLEKAFGDTLQEIDSAAGNLALKAR